MGGIPTGPKRQILKSDKLRSETRFLFLLDNCGTVLVSCGGGKKLSQRGWLKADMRAATVPQARTEIKVLAEALLAPSSF